MGSAIFEVPIPINEPVLTYAPGTPERRAVKEELERQASKVAKIPLVIGGQEIDTAEKGMLVMPHDHGHVLAEYSMAGEEELKAAVNAALDVRAQWYSMPWEHRASIFLKAADIITGPWRQRLNAATMLGQSKTIYQAEIDVVCEHEDFLRFNVHYAQEI